LVSTQALTCWHAPNATILVLYNKEPTMTHTAQAFADLPLANWSRRRLKRKLDIRAHSIAAKLAREAGFTKEPYLTFPLSAPSIKDVFDLKCWNDPEYRSMLMEYTRRGYHLPAPASAAVETSGQLPCGKSQMSIPQTLEDLEGMSAEEISALDGLTGDDASRVCVLVEQLLEWEPAYMTHCMSIWNRARRLQLWLSKGERISESLAWDDQEKAWVL
jgi:hypothetical protein